jgi:hypothetical protein
MASSMQFIKGIDEPTIPEVKLTRSRDGASGTGEPSHESLLLSWPSSPQPPGASTCRLPAPRRLISCPPFFLSFPFPAATFIFQNPAIFEASSELGDITGLYMNDDEGAITVRRWPSAKSAAGEPKGRLRAWLGCCPGGWMGVRHWAVHEWR